MKAVEQHQPNSIDSSDSQSVTGGNEYAYRPLTTKHRRAGSTGTTGDEEYTTDEDELYCDEADCTGISLHPPHPILKSDLARAATDLFGYSSKDVDNNTEPTSLFDDDDGNLSPDSRKLQTFDSPDINKETTISFEVDKIETKSKSEVVKFSQHLRPLNLRREFEIIHAETALTPVQKPSEESLTANQVLETLIEYPVTNVTADVLPRTVNLSSSNSLHWEKAVAEVKEHAITKLQDELRKTHEELKLKDEEVTRLSRFRQDVETELEELTANLFQEAHNMVHEANTRQATAERLLEENRMKTEVLAAEVAALKTLVLTSTPAHPNPHLHPQIDTRSRSSSSDDAQIGMFNKKHRRSPSHFNFKYSRENSPPESPVKEQKSSFSADVQLDERDNHDQMKEFREKNRNRDRNKDKDKENKYFREEIDPRVYSEFLTWKSNPCIDKSNTFVARVFREDIDLCLDFPNEDLGNKVQQAVLDGIILIEAISDKTKLAFPKKCALLEVPRQCHYRMRLSDQENQWYSISQICRNRIIAVCDFLNYLRYVKRGLVKSAVHDIYWEIIRLRKEMILARLGLILSS